MNTQYRVGRIHCPAGIDHLLATAFHLGVCPLYRIEIQRFAIGARSHRGSRASAKSDTHARPADLYEQRTWRQWFLVGVTGGDVTEAPCNHDRLVIAPHHAAVGLLIRPEVAGEVNAAEFVVECRPA